MKLKIVVIFGGMASEHEVSCKSAYNVIKNINKEKYDVSLIGITKQGIWYRYFGDVERLKNNTWTNDFDNLFEMRDLLKELNVFDVALPILHGKYGEDGKIQGLLELAKIKYIGCSVEGSAIGYNKLLSKTLVKNIGIDIVNYMTISSDDVLTEDSLLEKMKLNNLTFPVFVKPNAEGSSYGAKKASNLKELIESIIDALTFDTKVLVETYVGNKKEVECAVLGNTDLIISVPGEICSATEVYDYDSKYNNNESYTQIPANITSDIQDKIMQYSKLIFRKLELSGLSRIDFFVTANNEIYFNEVNTMPGFTDISMYPKMMENMGISYTQLIDRLIECAINR